ncbi:SDR family oxidoreductase [Candidatus Pelagibacter sp.]|nr:SDR family oxidoreductase [Candidatus Pelagibacter sp.]
MKIIAISGYKSFIGNHFYNNYKKKNKIIHYKNNINNISELKKFIIKNKVTHFVNFAGLSRIKCSKNKTECIKTNFNSIKSVINFFNKFKYKPMFIFISTCHIYGNGNNKIKENFRIAPNSLYAKMKLKSEEYIQKNYENYSILRLFNVYGPNQPRSFFIPDMIEKIKNNQLIKIDKSIRDFIHVRTVSRVINFIISKEIKGVLNVGSGRGQSLKSIINLIANKLEKKPLLEISNKKSKIVANIKFLTSKGFKFKKNEKNFNI